MRKTGILLHISSLPSDFGIGDFGPEAIRFAEYLKAEGYTYWQILPVNHCGYGNSPYNPLSAFALNPYFISPELLYQQGYINQLMLESVKIPRSNITRYEQVYTLKDKMLAQATANWMLTNNLDEYIEESASLLKPYLTFLSLSKIYNDTCWYNWNEEHRNYSEKLYQKVRSMDTSYFNLRAVTQAMLAEQLSWFKAQLHKLGIVLIGDLPLYLAYDSAEVWAHQEYFDLDKQGRRLHFAGVPPDAFAEKGQLWGNPLYKWDVLKQEGFCLFIERIKQALNYLDILRLDHFIGYVNFWQVEPMIDANGQPVLPDNAIQGSWVRALPEDFFTTLLQHFTIERFIAEDLGILNDDVCSIRERFGFPGMIVLQFCFEESVPDVKKYPPERWLYTGTHDNQTLRGWFESLSPDSPSYKHLQEYCVLHKFTDRQAMLNAENIHIIIRNIALSSSCRQIIFPYQDILGLGDEARMNIPGTALGNWQWRLEDSFYSNK